MEVTAGSRGSAGGAPSAPEADDGSDRPNKPARPMPMGLSPGSLKGSWLMPGGGWSPGSLRGMKKAACRLGLDGGGSELWTAASFSCSHLL